MVEVAIGSGNIHSALAALACSHAGRLFTAINRVVADGCAIGYIRIRQVNLQEKRVHTPAAPELQRHILHTWAGFEHGRCVNIVAAPANKHVTSLCTDAQHKQEEAL